ncbi:hypothetical protein TVAG_167190 [Trichomonas vaginalis G3]|uniref:Uncharacterized protein n=1 Tax=Trichomonas vaginalis (strain ATCC PRA-98 / G3) TaxID=412133 RepID=A2DEC6_TRIV3|nr:hypothetical protein TVAGG3_0175450 [Trichomonas vaginalis G3]EAY21344.1 hypothetical protein TVAG_167190 [Trichomonas vaginalis G3]KAI5548918.1 hypothetical protein TVAGG3_0175450 [Trichomonas vaginalis G3]|eukprot:XP_001582330.1 hypothetical protein [Trichomonas vaginalis G3]
MSVVLLFSACWFGYELTTCIIQNRFDFIYRASLGVGLGVALQSLSFFITSMFYPLNRFHGYFMCLTYMIFSLLLHFINIKSKQSLKYKGTLFETYLLIFCPVIVALAAKHCYLRDKYVASGPTFADLPFHLNIIRSFSTGINYNRSSLFDVWSSFQSNLSLAYPMFHNFYMAALMNTDDKGPVFMLQLTAALMCYVTIILIHGLALVYTKDHTNAAISILVWTNLGGFGYWCLFKYGTSFNTAVNFMNHLGTDTNAYTLQPLTQILIPQRSSLFSFPLVLGILMCFVKITQEKEINIRYIILAGLCTCTLPQLQVHSFVAIAQYSISLCLIFLFKTKEKFWPYFFKWSLYGLISCSIGIPLTYPFWGRAHEGKLFLNYKPIWDQNVYGKFKFPLIQVWWNGYGPFGYIMILFGWIAADKTQLYHWISSMVVWFFASFIRYQPWEGDNLKLFAACWIPIAVPYVTQFYLYVYRKAKQHKYIRYIVIFLIVQQMFAALISFPLELLKPLQVYFPIDEEAGYWIQENIPTDAVIYSYSSRFNPATSIAGRQLFYGFIYWVCQHGVYANNRAQTNTNLLNEKWNWNMWKNRSIGYVLQKKRNAPVFSHEDKPFLFYLQSENEKAVWETIFENEWYYMYKLSKENPFENTKVQPEHKVTKKTKKRHPKRTYNI